ncbi:TPA: hypothetical protein ACS73V_003885, partial [Providencia alcalifaciens]
RKSNYSCLILGEVDTKYLNIPEPAILFLVSHKQKSSMYKKIIKKEKSYLIRREFFKVGTTELMLM